MVELFASVVVSLIMLPLVLVAVEILDFVFNGRVQIKKNRRY